MADACDYAGRGVAAKTAGNAAACGKGARRSSIHNNVGDRLYSQVHVCNHARCAANDPNYNVKPPTPPKPFLVAKSRYRTYGGGAPTDEKSGRGGAAAAAEAKAAKNSKTGGRKDTADHDQSQHAPHSLANSNFQLPQSNGRRGNGSRYEDVPFPKGQGGRNKEQDRSKDPTFAHSALQHNRAWDSSVKDKKVHSSAPAGQRKLKPLSSVEKPKPSARKAATPSAAAAGRAHASGLSRTSSVTEIEPEAYVRRPLQQEPRRENSSSSILASVTPEVDQCNIQPREESPSPRSSITSISITQIISTSKRGGDATDENDGRDEDKIERQQQQQQHRRADDRDVISFSSPTASVGSNSDEEIISSFKETDVTLEGDNLDLTVNVNRSTVDISYVPRSLETPASPLTKELQNPLLRRGKDSQRDSSSTPLSVESERSTVEEEAAPASPTASLTSTNTNLSISESSSTGTSTATSSNSLSSQPTDDDAPAKPVTPSVTSRPAESRYLNSTIASAGGIPTQTQTPTSLKSKPSASAELLLHPPTPTSPPFSSSLSDSNTSKLRKSVSDSSKLSTPSPAKKPSRTQSWGSPVTTSSGTPSQLARAFITDLHAKTVARKAASSKGVRAIELRGGIARSYSKTTVTSLNVTTTTTIEEVSQSNAGSSSQQQHQQHTRGSLLPSELARSGSTPVGTKPPWQSSSKENSRPYGGWNASSTARNTDTKLKTAGSGTGLKFARRARTTTTTKFDELLAKAERVSLKHGEVAERRLSEEWMTDHALEGVVKKIADKDHRVKVLVHAFETLASLPDSEGSQNGDDNVKLDTQLVNEILSAAPIAA